MSAKKFKFVSPGVFLSEIDNSQLPKVPGGVGPAIIGRTRRGPAMKPVKVNSFQEFVEIFGEPMPGSEGEDPWRDGNGLLATAYAPYAAQAYLKADINSPVTVVRLLGVQGDDASDTGEAGWTASTAFGIFAAPGIDGIDDAKLNVTASLCGIIYGTTTDMKVGVEGTGHSGSNTIIDNYALGDTTTSKVVSVDIENDRFIIALQSGSATVKKSVSFREGGNYIRDQLNTNPVATNTNISYIVSGTLSDKYWLGETFEETYESVKRLHTTGTMQVFVARLGDNMADFKSGNHQLSEAKSGWVFPQHTGDRASFSTKTLQRLFRFCAVQEGEQGLDLHVCIENIKIADTGNPSPYGRFDVVVKQKRGGRIFVVDSFENLNLNPNSDNFIARKIGTQYFEWDGAQKRNKVYGSYPNNSSYIRVEMGPNIEDNGPTDPKSVPFGFFGPIIPEDLAADATTGGTANAYAAMGADLWVSDTTQIAISGANAIRLQWPRAPHVTTGSLGIDLQARYVFGSTPYNRTPGTNNINHVDVNKGMKDYLRRFSMEGTVLSDQISGLTGSTECSYVFSLDEIVVTGAGTPPADLNGYSPTSVNFIEASHVGAKAATATVTFTGTVNDSRTLIVTSVAADGTSTTKTYSAAGATDAAARQFAREGGIAVSAAGLKAAVEAPAGHNGAITVSVNGGIATLTQAVKGKAGNLAIGGDLNSDSNASVSGFSGGTATATTPDAYTALSDGTPAALLDLVNSFSMPLAGGFDGVNITEADPFNMSTRTVSGKTTRNSYAYATIDRAIDLLKDPETLEMNLAVMPGISNSALATKLVQTCEARADSMAIIDLPDVYYPPSEKKCATFKQRIGTTPEAAAKNLISRQINSSYGAAYYPWLKVRDTINGRDIWAPPSIVALGVMGYTEERDEVWFAPAGFNRGGLNEGNAGLPVLQVSEQLLSSQRDRLYEANINPIASFVSEGLVVFGQKTLQMTPSALDRINVRRLLIFVKKEISRIANGLLFDQNVPATWNRFTGQVVPFLESVKTRLGLTDFKVVLDKTTTTPDLVDRNIMYAKIFLKPARAIEFIAVDFVITRTGASFDD